MEHDSEKLVLGSQEIRILGSDGIIYAAPNLIYHYVVDHNYLPPKEFIEALINSPLPEAIEFLDHVKDYSWYGELKFTVADKLPPEDQAQYLAVAKSIESATPAGIKLKKVISTGEVDRIKWSPDGSILAISSKNTIGLWDPNTGSSLKTFPAQFEFRSNFDWSPDGQFIGAAPGYDTIKIWDVEQRKAHAVIKSSPIPQVKEVAYSPNGKFLAAYGRWNIIIYQAQTLELLKIIPLPKKRRLLNTNSIKWSNNSEYLAVGGESNLIHIYCTEDWSLAKVIKNIASNNNDLLWMSGDNTLLVASGSQYHKEVYVVAVWNVQNNQLVAQLQGHTVPVLSMSLSHDQTLLASKANDRTVRVWRCSDWANIATLSRVKSGYGMDFHPTLPILALPYYGDADGIAVWEFVV